VLARMAANECVPRRWEEFYVKIFQNIPHRPQGQRLTLSSLSPRRRRVAAQAVGSRSGLLDTVDEVPRSPVDTESVFDEKRPSGTLVE
jgi:hypothetical protein